MSRQMRNRIKDQSENDKKKSASKKKDSVETTT